MEKHFAALKLLDSDNNRTLTRAYSYSDLPSRQICMQQSYHSKNPPGLVRQYSCEQIFDETAKTRQLRISEVIRSGYNESRNVWQTVMPYSNSSNSFNWQFPKKSNVIQAAKLIPNKVSDEIEHMEVETIDLTKESEYSPTCQILNNENLLNTKQQSFDNEIKPDKKSTDGEETAVTKDKNTNAYSEIKKNIRSLVPETKAPMKKKRNLCHCNCMFLIFLSIAIGIIALILNPIEYNICNRTVIFSNAVTELQQKIYGQENAISSIVYSLNEDIYHLKVICLIGGTGVGKSYTIETIRKNFPNEKRMIIFDRTLGHDVDAKVLGSFGSYDLVIIENLKMKHLDVLANILSILKQNKVYCITVFAIFNVEEVYDDLTRVVDLTQSANTIINALEGYKMDISVIPYQPLNEQALNMCIMEAARYSNLELAQNQIDRIKQSLLSSNSGCKGAYSKVQVLGREQI